MVQIMLLSLLMSCGYLGPAENVESRMQKLIIDFPKKRGSPLIERKSYHLNSKCSIFTLYAVVLSSSPGSRQKMLSPG